MSATKTHYVASTLPGDGRGETACGMFGWRARGTSMEFETALNNRFEAHVGTWHGVDCKKCLASKPSCRP